MLGHLVTAQHGADSDTDLVGPVQRRRLRSTRSLMASRSRWVAASRSLRLRVRSAARSGLRQTMRRSPGKSGEVTTTMLRSSNSVSCNLPPSAKALISGARSAVIQSRLAGITSSRMRAWVIIPLSPTSTTRARLKRPFSLSI